MGKREGMHRGTFGHMSHENFIKVQKHEEKLKIGCFSPKEHARVQKQEEKDLNWMFEQEKACQSPKT